MPVKAKLTTCFMTSISPLPLGTILDHPLISRALHMLPLFTIIQHKIHLTENSRSIITLACQGNGLAACSNTWKEQQHKKQITIWNKSINTDKSSI